MGICFSGSSCQGFHYVKGLGARGPAAGEATAQPIPQASSRLGGDWCAGRAPRAPCASPAAGAWPAGRAGQARRCACLVEGVGRVVGPDVQHIHMVLAAVQLLKACWAAVGARQPAHGGPGGWAHRRRRPGLHATNCDAHAGHQPACSASSVLPCGPARRKQRRQASGRVRACFERLGAGAVAAACVRHENEHPRLPVVLAPLRRARRRPQRPQRRRMRQAAAAKLQGGATGPSMTAARQRAQTATCGRQAAMREAHPPSTTLLLRPTYEGCSASTSARS